MKKIIVFLGQKDMLYEGIAQDLHEGEDMISFDTDKSAFRDKDTYAFDVSEKELINKNLSICNDYDEITFIVSDDFFWDVSDSIRIDRLLNGAKLSIENLIYNRNITKLHVFFVSKLNDSNVSMTDALFLPLFNHVNKFSISGFHKNLYTHLINVIHNKTYAYDSYAKLELGYDEQDEENLIKELRGKIKKVCKILHTHLDENDSTSSICWIKDC